MYVPKVTMKEISKYVYLKTLLYSLRSSLRTKPLLLTLTVHYYSFALFLHLTFFLSIILLSSKQLFSFSFSATNFRLLLLYKVEVIKEQVMLNTNRGLLASATNTITFKIWRSKPPHANIQQLLFPCKTAQTMLLGTHTGNTDSQYIKHFMKNLDRFIQTLTSTH